MIVVTAAACPPGLQLCSCQRNHTRCALAPACLQLSNVLSKRAHTVVATKTEAVADAYIHVMLLLRVGNNINAVHLLNW